MNNENNNNSSHETMALRTRHLSANTGVYTQCTLADGRHVASVYLNLVNTVCKTSWPMGAGNECLEQSNSVHTGSKGSFIKKMFVGFDGRDKCSLLPFDVSSSVNITTVTNEGTRELLASGYGVLQHLGFGRTGGRCDGFFNKNCNFSALLHGVLNRTKYIKRMLTVRGLRFSRNAFFPPVIFSMTTDEGQIVKVQIYPPSLAVNLQNLTKDTVFKYAPDIFRDILCEADLDTSLMRFCVDAEWRLDRFVSPFEKFQLVVSYYSIQWLGKTIPSFDIVAAMHDFLNRGLQLFSLDHSRYWYSFEREKRENREIHEYFIEDGPLRRCPHAGPFRAFVVAFLSSRGHLTAVQAIRDQCEEEEEEEDSLGDSMIARIWYDTHVIDRQCLY